MNVTHPDGIFSLPIIHTFYGFYRTLTILLNAFQKKSRLGLGLKIENLTIETLSFIIRANYARSERRLTYLETASVSLDLLKILIRLCKDTGAMPEKHYILLQKELQETGRMLGGWIKSTQTKNPA